MSNFFETFVILLARCEAFDLQRICTTDVTSTSFLYVKLEQKSFYRFFSFCHRLFSILVVVNQALSTVMTIFQRPYTWQTSFPKQHWHWLMCMLSKMRETRCGHEGTNWVIVVPISRPPFAIDWLWSIVMDVILAQ